MERSLSVPAKTDHAIRERLLSCAIQLFNRKGYTATTVREIVTAAGVTKPVLYYYFRHKEGIYLELIGGAFGEFDRLLDAYRNQPGSPKERLLQLADQAFELFMRNIEVARLMYSIYYGPPQGAPFFDFDTYHLKFQNAIKDLVIKGIRKKEFRRADPEDMTWAILGVVNVAMEVRLCHPEIAIDRNRLEKMLRLIFQGIAPRKEKAKGGQG
jgi:AcrR family transcriptional regulator